MYPRCFLSSRAAQIETRFKKENNVVYENIESPDTCLLNTNDITIHNIVDHKIRIKINSN